MSIILNIQILEKASEFEIPKYATEGSAGLDLYAAIDKNIVMLPGTIESIDTGIILEIPKGFEGQIRPKSGLAIKHGITVLNSPGTIDSDYRGEIKILLINHNKYNKFIITRGMKIAQLVITKYYRADIVVSENLSNSNRGKGGFGSTGYY
ncbi:dUTP diphosphatase [Rickettsia endosymbiont of Cardiosporidium cionae]|uniref:dUTP diphosphatase n=1 Tax=Rickettsia endosymbiont of Cardiosporidium cionae TaxID=2777155 RepID=UPI00189358B3|nr:dUTP diphosphatase [Rickettsia endosymbiont of Cardiosporidium cionae]KAF8818675.1 dUTP diphosphatase [Rickettsia endosymbiont of Cardiosporidium cionae]